MSQLTNKKRSVPCCTTMELLTIFNATADAYPKSRAEQLNIKVHAALCERIETGPPAPSGSSPEFSQLDSQASGTTKLPATAWTHKGLELRFSEAISSLHRLDTSTKGLAFLEMVKPYVKHGVALSDNDYESLVYAISEAEFLCLDPDLDEYKLTPITRAIVRSYIAGKGFKKYVL